VTAADSQDSQDSQGRARLAAALAGRYTLRRELGRGGMATVYLAQDLRHDRPVALKVLHPELATALGPERFQREIRLAARLQHPHILTVHDSGEDAGRLWFTMPFVEGESLRDRLNRERQLPVDDAVRIAREAAQGLEYAHRHGVVHRDVKPENLLLTEDGNTLVADFGIARSLVPGGEQLTATGLSVGTAAYMSPEQAAGEREVDARSDVYSLACVLYEMLAGETPFAAATPQATLARRFTEAPRPVRQLRESVPEAVDRAVQTALARTAADRFATAADFARALAAAPSVAAPLPTRSGAAPAVTAPPVGVVSVPAGTAAATGAGAASQAGPLGALSALARRPLFTTLVLGFALGAGVLFAWRRSQPAGAAADGPPTIAVLPFENLGDSADAYFADGVTDAVRGKLSELPGVRVIARASSNQYRVSPKTPHQIGAELGVQYLLTATVRWQKAGAGGVSRVQVRPELVQLSGGPPTTRWEQPFDASLTDVFKVQGEIAGQVAQALRVALDTAQRTRLAEAPTADPAAYDAFLRAEAAWSAGDNTAPVALRQALAQYERAVALDSTFAAAWGGLARAAALLYSNSTPTPDLARRVKAAAERAAALDPDGAAGHRALRTYYSFVEGDNDRSLAEAEAAYRRSPGDAAVVAELVAALRGKGRWEEALRHAQAAYALDPRTAGRPAAVAQMYLWLRRPAEARPTADRALALAPANPVFVERRAMVSLAEGDLAGARRVLRAATEVPPEDLAAYMAIYWDLGWALDDAGQRLALSLSPESFDGDRAILGIVRAQLYGWRGGSAQSRAWGDTAERYFAAQLRDLPDDPQRQVVRGLALAYAGRFQEAIAAGERGVALRPVSADGYQGPYLVHQLARIYLLAGEREKALDRLESLMKVPYYLSPAWLRIDPDFAPLRGNPRFERLAAGG